MAGPRRTRKSRSLRGLTLLELLLALSLTVLVLMSIGMAIDMHFRMLELRRTNVEEAVQVRSMMNHISRDLIGTIQFVPPDTSGLDVMIGNSATAAANIASGNTGDVDLGAIAGGGATGGQVGQAGGQGGTGDQGATGGQAQTQTQANTSQANTSKTGGTTKTGGTQASGSKTGGSTGGATGGQTGSIGAVVSAATSAASSAGTTETTEAPATTTAAAGVIGLYGSATELKIDVSRLPRIDQYDASLTASDVGASEIPSDVKTIIYFLGSEDTPPVANLLGPQDVEPSTTGTGKGLMRREIDRAVKLYAESNGDAASLYSGSRLVSDRVVGLQFQYFDGTAWQVEWDSETSGGLPKAVEIILTIQPTYGMTEAEIEELDPDTLPPPKDYRMVVKLPTANPATTTAEETTDAAATDASGAAASGSTSAPPAQGAMQ